jgi:hypothetical protein
VTGEKETLSQSLNEEKRENFNLKTINQRNEEKMKQLENQLKLLSSSSKQQQQQQQQKVATFEQISSSQHFVLRRPLQSPTLLSPYNSYQYLLIILLLGFIFVIMLLQISRSFSRQYRAT